MIGDIHRRFLEAGADIIETNTFGATTIAQSEFFVDDPREHGGRKDPEFYQKIIRRFVSRQPCLGHQLAIGAAVPRMGRSGGDRDFASALRCGSARPLTRVTFKLSRCRRSRLSVWSRSTR